jgi:methyl-accepting chemotaxis protein
VGKIRSGEQLVNETNKEFVEVRTGSRKVVELMGEIAAASNEQSQGIDQINTAILQMNTVTQKNAASAEELAASMATFVTEIGDSPRRTSAGSKRAEVALRNKRALALAAPDA